MASTVISSSSASTKALLSHRKASVTTLQSHERTFSSSLFGTRPGITRRAITTTTTTTTTRPVIRRGARHSGVRFSVCSALPSALLFDCDGVLVDTEKDGHRISFNDTFAEVPFLHSSAYFCFFFLPLFFLVNWFFMEWVCYQLRVSELSQILFQLGIVCACVPCGFCLVAKKVLENRGNQQRFCLDSQFFEF